VSNVQLPNTIIFLIHHIYLYGITDGLSCMRGRGGGLMSKNRLDNEK
jgi:hypothetical protein